MTMEWLKHGLEAPGDPIEGSQYLRAYCAGCDEPIRVTSDAFHMSGKNYCGDCRDDPERRRKKSKPHADRPFNGGGLDNLFGR